MVGSNLSGSTIFFPLSMLFIVHTVFQLHEILRFDFTSSY